MVSTALQHCELSAHAKLFRSGGVALLLLLNGCVQGMEREDSDRSGYPDIEHRAEIGISALQFADVSAEVGLDFENISGSVEQNYILETMSAGAAFLDYDGDGYLDLFVVNGTRLKDPPEEGENKLYHNQPDPGGMRVFREVETDLGPGGWGMGCAVGDYDNDGDPDVYATYWGPNRLYRNQGDGRFTEIAQEAGVADQGWGSSAAFGDLDGDGLLDLYATNYLEFDLENPPGGGYKCHYKGLEVFCGPRWVPPQPDRLYRNQGNGRFVDKSAALGGSPYPALGVAISDLDGDGDLDLYVANDGAPNLLYRNEGNWHFAEIGTRAGVAYSGDGQSQAGMGVHSGDFDNDGDLDLFVTNFSDDVNTLYQNEGGSFKDATYEAGLGGMARPYLGWGTGFFDFDNDGWLDLFVANGHLYPQLEKHSSGLRYAQRNLLYHNRSGRFVEVGEEAGPGWRIARVSRAAALGDFDNDGDVDLFLMNLNHTPTLLRNQGGNRNNWLGLELVGVESNRDAIGARVRIKAGAVEQVREVQRGYGFQAQHDPRLLFGLGQGQQVERVEIRWPSGRHQVVETPPLRRYLRVREGSDEVEVLAAAPAPEPQGPAGDEPEAKTAVAEPFPQIGDATWSGEDYLQAGKDMNEEGRYGEARAALERALQLNPDSLSVYINLGVVLYSGMGRYQEATAVLEQAASRHPERADPHYWLGKVYLSQNRTPEAIQVLEQASALAGSSWECHNQLGLAYIRGGLLEEAAAALQQASGQAPWAPEPHLHLGQVYETLGRVEEARRERQLFVRFARIEERVERYQLQVETYPGDARARSNLAMAYGEQGRYEEALGHFQQAIELDPGYGRAHYGMATVLYRQNRLEQAILAYERACRVQPDMVEGFNDLGQAYYRAGHYDRAVAAYQRALELRPGLALVHSNLGQAYAVQGHLEEAIREWETLLRLDPDHPQAVGWIRRARQKTAER